MNITKIQVYLLLFLTKVRIKSEFVRISVIEIFADWLVCSLIV